MRFLRLLLLFLALSLFNVNAAYVPIPTTLGTLTFTNAGNVTIYTLSNTAGLASGQVMSFSFCANGTNNPIFTAQATVSGTGTLTNFSLVFSGGISYPTNSNPVTPDFSIPAQLFGTNASFTFLPPINIDPTHLTLQRTTIFVTNSSSSVINVTAPANCAFYGTMNVTNISVFTFETYAGLFTNMYALPHH